jgi:hypothetical protein
MKVDGDCVAKAVGALGIISGKKKDPEFVPGTFPAPNEPIA